MSVNSIPNWTEIEQERILDYLSTNSLSIKHVDEFLVDLDLDQQIKDFINTELVKLSTDKELLDWFVNDLKALLEKLDKNSLFYLYIQEFLLDWESMSFEQSIQFFNKFKLFCSDGYDGLELLTTLNWIDSLERYDNIHPELERIKKHLPLGDRYILLIRHYLEYLYNMANYNLHSSIKSLQVFADFSMPKTKIQSILIDLICLYYKLNYVEKAKDILRIGLMYARDANDTDALQVLLNWTKVLDGQEQFVYDGDPFDSSYLCHKAFEFKKQGKTVKHIACLELVDNDYSNNQMALNSMLETSISLLMKKKGDYKQALRVILFDYYYNTKQYRRAQELIHETIDNEWKVRQGLLYFQYGDYDKLNILKESGEWGLIYLSMIYIENNQIIKAQQTILKAIVESHSLVNSIANLVFALVLLLLNEKEKAKAKIESVELDVLTNADLKWQGYCFYIKGLIEDSDWLIKEALRCISF
ncbi:hypothetical protein HK103_000060 [Boothiomyces macroporosus]|uniref:Anaphase-promoting complex subunit 5 domain-containing protein n=1 Tax=Boothiomyces macroporosus TaxID=261099 RepID=A0AAD5URU0_9FUNG|nr:hypothetical protein HK103_000060 [Boothiomyces macroporosus]